MAAPRIRVQAGVSERAGYLAGSYADIAADRTDLKRILSLLVRLQGHERVNRWKAMVDDGEFVALAQDLITRHYDSRYATARGDAGEPAARIDITLDTAGLERAADLVLAETLRLHAEPRA